MSEFTIYGLNVLIYLFVNHIEFHIFHLSIKLHI